MTYLQNTIGHEMHVNRLFTWFLSYCNCTKPYQRLLLRQNNILPVNHVQQAPLFYGVLILQALLFLLPGSTACWSQGDMVIRATCVFIFVCHDQYGLLAHICTYCLNPLREECRQNGYMAKQGYCILKSNRLMLEEWVGGLLYRTAFPC